jgi:putative selenium metabolism hydrolase
MTSFLRDLIAIPSESAQEGPVVERVRAEMERVGFDEVRVDGLGSVLGRVGSGERVIAMDAHLDTVGIGDPTSWTRDPYGGEVEDGIVFGRGASDQEGGMAALVYAGAILQELGLASDFSVWMTGTVMEEDCDGLCWRYLLSERVLAPEVVVITEPTNLGVYRGQRGRLELEVRTRGLSAHGSAPERGVNAIYKMAPVLAEVERLNADLAAGADPFLGKGSVTVSDIRATSPSLCAVADSCTIHLDRRLTRGETLASAVAQIEALSGVRDAAAQVRVLDYDRAAYTGLTYPTQKYYPAWVLEEDHEVVAAAAAAAAFALGAPPHIGKWTFSTNGVATCGVFGIPTVGFGPGDERHAHSPEDQCPIEHLTKAAAFYAAFPSFYRERAVGRTRGGAWSAQEEESA